MSNHDDGGPAFPGKTWAINPLNGNSYEAHDTGMSLRDWFAGQALVGLCANPALPPDHKVGEYAYAIADRTLAARKQDPRA